jgi:hypothetical protein
LTQLTMAAGGGRPGRQSRQSRTSGSGTRLALRLIGLALLGHMLRSRRFYERMAVGAVVLAALRGINQESRASTLERLAAWNKRQADRFEHQAERQALLLERHAARQALLLQRQAELIERQAGWRRKRFLRKAKSPPALNQ